jgi:4-hydroxy-tetrahydrodipicolinate synthase
VTLSGTWYVMPTAFRADGELDIGAQRALTEAVVSWRVDGITVLGVMGEASTLTSDERAAVISAVATAAPGTALAAGCSGAGIHAVVSHVLQARESGASYAMVSAPPLMRDIDALPAFMGAVSARGGLPIIVQDEPAATGVNLPVSILKQCLDASSSTIVKLEDPPTAPKITKLLDAAPGTAIFGGLGGAAAYFELRRGAVGTMTGFSYPEILTELRRRLAAGDTTGAYSLYARYLPLIAIEATPVVGLGVRKELLRRRGALPSTAMRLGAPPGADLLSELDEVLDAVGIVPDSAPFQPV